ncbi:MAG: hypothetical protein U0792_22620 [Gemmataceae bacterium]
MAVGRGPGTGAGQVSQIKVVNDKAPDCTTLKTIVDSTRGARPATKKAIAIYNFMRLTHYHRAYPSESRDIPVLKEINCCSLPASAAGCTRSSRRCGAELGWNRRLARAHHRRSVPRRPLALP